MTKHPAIASSEHFVSELMTGELSSDLHYHNLPHTLAVRDACLELAQRLNLPEEDQEILELAALFHDTGFRETYEGHEMASQRIARDFLLNKDYPGNKLEKVLNCIEATYPPNPPSDLLEAVIKDADLWHLANDNYLEYIEALRHEWEVFLGQTYDEAEWHKLNYDFLKNQEYYTSAAQELYGERKEENQKKLKKMVKKDKKKKETAAEPVDISNLASSKSAQMMFKTALRNHLDLSNLADNKANIMLSVNALIITIAMPVAASYVYNNPYLLAPMASLLATCLVSMIFATLATRPIKMTGRTDDEKIQTGNANLFFFGNFYKMTFSEYQKGMEVVLANEKKLEGAVMRDLYFLGLSLGQKYHRLRITYTVFMVGIIATVVIFGITYTLYSLNGAS